MQRLRYRIKTLLPVLITDNAGDVNTVNTGDYITGSSILGIFANNYLRKHKTSHEDPVFCNWFLRGHIKFTGAYIVNKDTGKTHYPGPLSIQKEKTGNRIYDLLYKDPEELEEQTKYIGDFTNIKEDSIDILKVKKSLNFHHARDPERGTGKKGLIFNYESMDRGQIFEGNILGEKEALEEFLKEFRQISTVYIGRSKNTQYGKAEIELDTDLKEFSGEIEGLHTDEDELSLSLLSDCIIYNQNGFSTTDIKVLEQEIKKSLGECTDFEIKKAFVKTGNTGNFNSAWRLPVPSETCFAAGSTFLIKVNEKARTSLLKLQSEGIGERKNEGFGRFITGWQEGNEELTERKHDSPSPPEPLFSPPDLTRHIIESTIKNFIEKGVKLEAIKKTDEFTYYFHAITPSLLGRLEKMIENSNRKNFSENLSKLRRTAGDKLRKCRSKSQTLYDFLDKHEIDADKILNNRPDLKELAGKAKLSLDKDPEFSRYLFEKYFTTFFAIMRKKLKIQKGER